MSVRTGEGKVSFLAVEEGEREREKERERKRERGRKRERARRALERNMCAMCVLASFLAQKERDSNIEREGVAKLQDQAESRDTSAAACFSRRVREREGMREREGKREAKREERKREREQGKRERKREACSSSKQNESSSIFAAFPSSLTTTEREGGTRLSLLL